MGWIIGGLIIAVLISISRLVFDIWKKKDVLWWEWTITLILLCGGLYMGIFGQLSQKQNGVDKDDVKNKKTDSSLRHTDTSITTAAEEIKKGQTFSTDTVLKNQTRSSKYIIDSLKKALASKEDIPRIDIYPFNGMANPVMRKTSRPDSFRLEVFIKNDGAYAWKFEFQSVIIYEINGTLYPTPKTKVYQTDESKSLINNDKKIGFVSSIVKPITDSFYLSFLLSYSDERNRKYPPLHRIYRFTGREFDESLPIAISPQYVIIKRILIERELWN